MSRMPFLMVSCVRMFTCIHHQDILSLRAWFIIFVAPFMPLSKLLGLGFSVLPLWSQLLVFQTALMIWLSVYVSPRGRTLLLYVDDMIITGDDPEYIAFVNARLSDQFLISDLGLLRYFLEIEISTPEGFFLSQEKYI
jgi:hypothetical protein